jgi:4-methyl-5(b-hydroxyethyl)-thiazole monophosphate biosynthesis
MTKTICILLAKGFEESEAVVPADLLKRLGVNVVFTSINDNKEVKGTHGFTLIADTTINNISADNFDVLMLPGGLPGSTNLRDNKNVITLVQNAYKEGKIISAICAAPIVLKDAGIADNKRITGYPDCEQLSQKYEFSFTGNDVEVDGKIITAKALGKAHLFAFAIAKALGFTDNEIKDLAQSTFTD